MAGARVSAWRWPRAAWNEASTPSWPPMAQPTWVVAVSMPRISMVAASRVGHPAIQRLAQVLEAGGPRRARRSQAHDPLVVALAELQTHLEEVGRQGRKNRVTPFD